MIYGYARCSTDDSKQEINRQIRELKNMGATKIYHEYAKGTDTHRSQLQLLRDRVNAGDTIIVTELSRFTRSLHHLCHLIEWAIDKQITIKAGGFSADCSNGIDPMIEGMFYIMGIFAQLERRIITQRVRSGVAHAKSKGVRLGRPPMTKDKLPQAFHDHYPAFKSGMVNKAEFARLVGCSRPTLYRHLDIFLNR